WVCGWSSRSGSHEALSLALADELPLRHRQEVFAQRQAWSEGPVVNGTDHPNRTAGLVVPDRFDLDLIFASVGPTHGPYVVLAEVSRELMVGARLVFDDDAMEQCARDVVVMSHFRPPVSQSSPCRDALPAATWLRRCNILCLRWKRGPHLCAGPDGQPRRCPGSGCDCGRRSRDPIAAIGRPRAGGVQQCGCSSGSSSKRTPAPTEPAGRRSGTCLLRRALARGERRSCRHVCAGHHHRDVARPLRNASFILNLFTFAVVPLLTLLSSEFPELRSALFAWVQPLVNAFVKQ